jgi:prepilin-type N-terminal cleavage/methylation domain-containing protein
MSGPQEDGFTLVELMVSVSMMLVLLAAVLPVLVSATTQQDNQASRVSALDDDRVAIERMTHELREACTVTPSSVAGTSTASVTAVKLRSCGATAGSGAAVQSNLTYNCGIVVGGVRRCVRTDNLSGHTLELIKGISGGNVFTVFGASADGGRPRVAVHLQKIPEGSERPVTLSGSASLRYIP